ncbi:CdaR family protein [Melissococcus plutonius]|uniref:CdaR family protein n=1 Tax=Melissococcus plutonius TaxID=33970 RepID=UPI00065DD873|nr:CdaR family protein [Melissococcus plutonius]AIM25680.1 YbbR-like protein [Melissococcus plutonius S1]KMT24946.1 YbbR-like protein [Melissococcus plutonius]KMT31648.1 YbbR-like protein [Melissococcus plutonius]KMT36490.1 YbbR-like protein [Melissococcus plutonius]KMT36953.1 YbbR-like protein [Melissococcus plutonius]
MRKSTQSNLFYGFISLMFALLLFFNANSQGSIERTVSTQDKIYDETLNNIPVQIVYNQDKYFVSGYEKLVSVRLKSANRIQLNSEANEDTRSFKIIADLTNTRLGTSEVQLQAQGLSSAVTAEIQPKMLTVTLEKKITREYKVETKLPDLVKKEGYTIDDISLNPESVKITTGTETAKTINRVIAPIASTNQSTDRIKQVVNVQALDSKGQVLPIEAPPPKVEATIKLLPKTKEVPLIATANGTAAKNVSYYNFNLSKLNVAISGPGSVIDSINQLELPINISDIKKTTKKSIEIPVDNNYTVDPKRVEVTILPVFKKND